MWASSHKVLPDIRVPFLAVNAADDPIVQEVSNLIHQICGRCSAPTPQHGRQGQPQPTSGDDSDKEEKEKHWWQRRSTRSGLGYVIAQLGPGPTVTSTSTCQIGGGILAGALAVGAG